MEHSISQYSTAHHDTDVTPTMHSMAHTNTRTPLQYDSMKAYQQLAVRAERNIRCWRERFYAVKQRQMLAELGDVPHLQRGGCTRG